MKAWEFPNEADADHQVDAQGVALVMARQLPPDTLADGSQAGSYGPRLARETWTEAARAARCIQAMFADLGRSSADTGFPFVGVPPAVGAGDAAARVVLKSPFAVRPKTARCRLFAQRNHDLEVSPG